MHTASMKQWVLATFNQEPTFFVCDIFFNIENENMNKNFHCKLKHPMLNFYSSFFL